MLEELFFFPPLMFIGNVILRFGINFGIAVVLKTVQMWPLHPFAAFQGGFFVSIMLISIWEHFVLV